MMFPTAKIADSQVSKELERYGKRQSTLSNAPGIYQEEIM